MYGLISSVVGFPIGLVLNLPAVWGLALLGIFIGALKLYMSDVEKIISAHAEYWVGQAMNLPLLFCAVILLT